MGWLRALARLLPNIFVRILVFPDSEKDWLTETIITHPPRAFYLADERRSRGVLGQSDEVAKQQGGDGVLMQSDAAQYMGSLKTGNAFTTANGNFYGNGFNGSALTTGTSISTPMIRREGRFLVIKYL